MRRTTRGFSRKGPARRGMGLIEVLVGMTLMAIVVSGILQMFSLALFMSFGAGTRTELTAKCAQVVENLRVAQAVQDMGLDPSKTLVKQVGLADSAGTSYDVTAGPLTVLLPYTAADFTAAATKGQAFGPYWGPTQANVVDAPDGPYRLSYRVETSGDAPDGMVLVTVTATVVNNPSVIAAQNAGSGLTRKALGMSGLKRVDYVAYINH